MPDHSGSSRKVYIEIESLEEKFLSVFETYWFKLISSTSISFIVRRSVLFLTCFIIINYYSSQSSMHLPVDPFQVAQCLSWSWPLLVVSPSLLWFQQPLSWRLVRHCYYFLQMSQEMVCCVRPRKLSLSQNRPMQNDMIKSVIWRFQEA